MKKYTFILGDNTDEKRIYSGTLLSPIRGFKLGMKFAKLVSEIVSKTSMDFKLEDLVGLGDESKLNKELMDKFFYYIIEGLNHFDPDKYMSLVEEIITKSSIHAKIDGKPDVQLNDLHAMNKWFVDFPEDMIIFTANILWRNSTPFLPKGILTKE